MMPPTVQTNLKPSATWRTHASLALLALVYIFSYIARQVPSHHDHHRTDQREFGASDVTMACSPLDVGILYTALGITVAWARREDGTVDLIGVGPVPATAVAALGAGRWSPR